MLTSNEKALHEMALKDAANFKRGDANLIKTLIKVERSRYYRKLGRRNLVEFVIKDLKIDSTYTFDLNRVTRAALEHPEMARQLESGKLRVGHATRILGKITKANAGELVEYATKHTFAEVGRFIADSNPEQKTRETTKRLSADQIRVSMVLTQKIYDKLQRVQALEAQRQSASKMMNAIDAACDAYLLKHDPVVKAERALSRPRKITIRENVRTSQKRKPLMAKEKHQVFKRTQGRCSFHNHEGQCKEDRDLHIHHIVPVAEGGSNEPSNLTLLCSFHHQLVHQLMFPGLPPLEYSFANTAST